MTYFLWKSWVALKLLCWHKKVDGLVACFYASLPCTGLSYSKTHSFPLKNSFQQFLGWEVENSSSYHEHLFCFAFCAILRIAFITENETKVYRFHLVSLHISIVHCVVILGTKIKYCQRTIMTTVSSLGVYIWLSVIFWVNFKAIFIYKSSTASRYLFA